MTETKKELILNTANEIAEMIEEKYGVLPDYCDIAYFINANFGFVVDALDESLEKLGRK